MVKIEGVQLYDDSYEAVLLHLQPFPASEYEELISTLIESNVVRSLPSRSGASRQVVNQELSLLASVDSALSSRVATLRESGKHAAALVYLRMLKQYLTSGRGPHPRPWVKPQLVSTDLDN
jgi:fumarylacetoacetate (FAA) hydrolase family protein